jgi:glycosyltransferase involved in cell wall biosynthesis
MKIAISATNPCHLFDLAKEFFRRDALGAYLSGYPAWRLRPPAGFPLRVHPVRTVITYGLLRLPAKLRPNPNRLFRWQDAGFDRAAAADVAATGSEIIHAMPGQALHTFRAARAAGIETCLNHASGPVRQQVAILEREWARRGIDSKGLHRFDESYFRQEQEEYALADWHCAASTLVRDQLVAAGVRHERIWVAPYGADLAVFHPPPDRTARATARFVFAGQLTLRKGLRTLFDAFAAAPLGADATLDCYGAIAPDARNVLHRAQDDRRIRCHGAVTQRDLAAAFRAATAVILPSQEEAFGLVIPQALSCGAPCIVSDRVGAQDLIRPHRNGSVFPVDDVAALAAEMMWWREHAGAGEVVAHSWDGPAELLLQQMRQRKTLPV